MLLSSSNRKYPPFPLLSYFFVVVCLRYLLHHIECKYSDMFWLADRNRLFVQNTISLSSLCKLILSHWTYKMPVRYILSSVWVSIFSPLFIIQYVGLYVFSLPIFLVMIERIYILCLIIVLLLSFTAEDIWKLVWTRPCIIKFILVAP